MSGSTRSHFTHARSCSRALNRVPTRAKRPAFHPDVLVNLWKGDIFPFDRFAGDRKRNQNQLARVLSFAFALTCYKICLNMHHCNALFSCSLFVASTWYFSGLLESLESSLTCLLQCFKNSLCFRSGLWFWTKSPLCLSLVVTWSILMLLAPCLALPQVLLCQPPWIDFPNRGKLIRFRQFSVWLFVSLPHCHFADGRACF